MIPGQESSACCAVPPKQTNKQTKNIINTVKYVGKKKEVECLWPERSSGELKILTGCYPTVLRHGLADNKDDSHDKADDDDDREISDIY